MLKVLNPPVSNTLNVAEIKRRGMAVIEERLQHGPVHIVKRNKLAAVVLSEAEYARMTSGQPAGLPGLTAVQWLLQQPTGGTRTRAEIDAALANERDWSPQ